MLLLPTCRYILNFRLLQLNQVDLFEFICIYDATANAILANLIYYNLHEIWYTFSFFFFTQLVKFCRTVFFLHLFLSFKF